MINQSAQGLASLGRNGDTMLVHMNPTEVAGLQSLAMAHGGSLTVNPDTGMPEAFNLGGVFSAALPMIAGAALGPAGFGLSGLQAGLLVGGATALLSGDIGKGIMAGFGAGAGSGLGESLSNFAKQGAASNVPTSEFMGDVIQNQVASTNTALPAGTFGGAGTTGLGASTGGFGAPISGQGSFLGAGVGKTPITNFNFDPTSSFMKPVTNAPAIPTQSLTPELATGVNKINLADTANLVRPETGPGNILTGMSRAVQEPGKFVDYLGGGWEATKKVGLPLAGAVMGGLEESDLYPTVAYGAAASSYPNVDPVTGALRLGYDTGLRLKPTYAAEGGEIKSYAIGGNVGNPSVGGGLSDLYNRPEGQALETISNDGYGIGRLNSLAAQESLNNAKVLGYKIGGYLDGQGDGMSDSIPATIEGKQPARLADGEFVVPADVVSHLGNGSSKAGSKKLYAMMDKVRTARTGTKKQGKQINPDKYVPKVA